MAFTVGDVILGARDLNPAFTPTRHPDAVCRRFLTRYMRQLMTRIVTRRPRALPATETTVALPLADFNAGVTIPAGLLLSEVLVQPAGNPARNAQWPVKLVAPGTRHDGGNAGPWGWLDGQTLRLAGDANQWAGSSALVLRTIATPTAFTANADVIPLPDDGEGACVHALGAFLASRPNDGTTDDEKPRNTNSLRADADAAEAEFIGRMLNQSRAESFKIREVW